LEGVAEHSSALARYWLTKMAEGEVHYWQTKAGGGQAHYLLLKAAPLVNYLLAAGALLKLLRLEEEVVAEAEVVLQC
jgi:hypothetical protein